MSKEQYVVKVEPRTEKGKNEAGRIRRKGFIPGIVYGAGIEAKKVKVNARAWAEIARHEVNLVTLEEDGGEATKALIKEVQIDHLKNRYLHIDFQQIRMDQIITASIAIHALPGDPVGLSQGGSLEQPMHEIEVSCLPADLPEAVEVDISGIELDESLHVRDLALPEGVTTDADPDIVVFHVSRQVEEAEEPEAAEGEGTAEGGEAAEGAPEKAEDEKEGKE